MMKSFAEKTAPPIAKPFAVIVDCLTDNRNRTAGEIRHYFDKCGGNMGTSGCVSFMFSLKGVIVLNNEDGDIDEDQEKKDEEQTAEDAHKAALDFVKEALGDAVKEVRASKKLKSHPVCLTAGEGLSFEMEKYFRSVQPDSAIKADRILELNVEHPAFQALEAAVTADPEKAKKYATLLYDQALLIAGLPLEDPSGYTDLVCELMK